MHVLRSICNSPNRRVALMIGMLTAVWLAGCAVISRTPEEVVTARVDQHWKALMAGDWASAYEMILPSYRANSSLERYRERFVGVPKWKSVTVRSAKCEAEKCVVTVRIEAAYGGRGGLQTLSTDLPETWLLESGQWYKYESL